MDNIGRLFDQVAAEAGVTANRAKLAVYVMGLANAGRPLSDIAAGLKRKPDTSPTPCTSNTGTSPAASLGEVT